MGGKSLSETTQEEERKKNMETATGLVSQKSKITKKNNNKKIENKNKNKNKNMELELEPASGFEDQDGVVDFKCGLWRKVVSVPAKRMYKDCDAPKEEKKKEQRNKEI